MALKIDETTGDSDLATWLATRGPDNDESVTWGRRDLPSPGDVSTALGRITRAVGPLEARVHEGELHVMPTRTPLPWVVVLARVREVAPMLDAMSWSLHYSLLTGSWVAWRADR